MAQDYTAQYQALVDNSPEYQEWLRRYNANRDPKLWQSLLAEGNQILDQLQTQLPAGINLKDYKVNAVTGRVSRDSYLERNAEWAVPALMGGVGLGGGYALGSAFPGTAAATPVAGAGGTAATATPAVSVGGVSAPGIATSGITPGFAASSVPGYTSIAAPAVTAGAAGIMGSIWDHLPTIIGAGTGILATKMQSDAVKDASKTQEEAADKALALQREMFDLERADNAPYRNLGAYAVGGLGHLVGMPENYGTEMAKAEAKKWTPESAVTSAAEKIKPLIERWQGTAALDGLSGAATQAAGSVVPQMDGGQLAQSQTGSSYVQMEAPTGERKMVPEHKVWGLEQRGARRV